MFFYLTFKIFIFHCIFYCRFTKHIFKCVKFIINHAFQPTFYLHLIFMFKENPDSIMYGIPKNVLKIFLFFIFKLCDFIQCIFYLLYKVESLEHELFQLYKELSICKMDGHILYIFDVCSPSNYINVNFFSFQT